MSDAAQRSTADSSYAAGLTDVPLLTETIGANLAATVARFADNDALVDCPSGRRWTYAEFDRDVDVLARGLLAAGIDTGDRVGIWSPNRPEWTLLQYATARAGIILVNINPAYRTHELVYVLNQSGCRMIVSATAYKSSEYRAMVETVRPDCPTLEQAVFLDDPSWDALLAGAPRCSVERLAEVSADLSADDPINIQYTSGTTGRPKGATLSHTNILNNGFFVTETIGLTDRDRLVIPVPFYHCFGMVMANLGCTTHGATMIIPAPTFDPASALQAVQDEKATALYGVPTMFIAEQALPDFGDYDLSTLRTGVMAGSTCPVEVMKRCLSDMHMAEVSIAYGMTETSPVSAQTLRDDDVERRTATIGRVHPHV